jgi:hypothetical protein
MCNIELFYTLSKVALPIVNNVQNNEVSDPSTAPKTGCH